MNNTTSTTSIAGTNYHHKSNTTGRGRVTLVMVSSFYSTSERGRVTLVMLIGSCSTSGRVHVTLVIVSSSFFTSVRVRPLPLVDQELLPSQE
jgi:hypothetical protein